MRLLALDFDGVISDSAPEAFVVALRTFVEMRPTAACREHPLLRIEGAPAPDQVRGDALYARFLELMPLGNRAEDYAVVLAALDESARLPDQPAYDAFRDACDRDWLRAYHRRFYAVRAALSRRDPEGWRRLMSAYPELPAILRRRADEVELAIATAKDRRSVRSLLGGYGIDALFPEGRVLDKETGVSKAAHLAHLSERCGVAFRDITFVDDKLNHLDATSELGVRCVLAAWGYNGPREIVLARERGYLVCDLEGVERQLFGD